MQSIVDSLWAALTKETNNEREDAGLDIIKRIASLIMPDPNSEDTNQDEGYDLTGNNNDDPFALLGQHALNKTGAKHIVFFIPCF